MPDYENDIVFKSAMTEKELIDWVKEKYKDNENIEVDDDVEGCESIAIVNHDGDCIEFDINTGWVVLDGTIIARDVLPEKVKTIIQALYEE
jgi:hypothetical protein